LPADHAGGGACGLLPSGSHPPEHAHARQTRPQFERPHEPVHPDLPCRGGRHARPTPTGDGPAVAEGLQVRVEVSGRRESPAVRMVSRPALPAAAPPETALVLAAVSASRRVMKPATAIVSPTPVTVRMAGAVRTWGCPRSGVVPTRGVSYGGSRQLRAELDTDAGFFSHANPRPDAEPSGDSI
jgi:hypothetical protein